MPSFETSNDHFQADYTGFEDLYSDLKEISLPELDSFLSLAITLIPTQKIRLIESEEHIMTTICILRKKYSIPGVVNLTHFSVKIIYAARKTWNT
jgi:hypothetical protein